LLVSKLFSVVDGSRFLPVPLSMKIFFLLSFFFARRLISRFPFFSPWGTTVCYREEVVRIFLSFAPFFFFFQDEFLFFPSEDC